MLYKYSEEELRSICRSNIETFEIWARRFIDDKMNEKYGPNYLDFKLNDGNYLIRKEIRDKAHYRKKKEPDRFPKIIDALSLDHLSCILCNPLLYKTLFKKTLDNIYPQGRDEAREFLDRLIPIRNCLDHANVISVHQAEQAVCYTNDFVDGIKKYFRDKGMAKVWNIPKIIYMNDSLGNVFENFKEGPTGVCPITIKHKFYCGDIYSVNIEVDSSFPPDEYTIKWSANRGNHVQEGGEKFVVKFNEKDIGENNFIYCDILTKRDWHKFNTFDFSLSLKVCVLPPF